MNTPLSNEEELQAAIELFAKDFHISYDKMKISRHKEYVSYKTDTGGSGGWTEGTPAVQIKLSIILRYAEISEDRKAREAEIWLDVAYDGGVRALENMARLFDKQHVSEAKKVAKVLRQYASQLQKEIRMND